MADADMLMPPWLLPLHALLPHAITPHAAYYMLLFAILCCCHCAQQGAMRQ